jgi:hypothetical protein
MVFGQNYTDEPLLKRVARLTHEVLDAPQETIDSLALTEQVDHVWQALKVSTKYAARGPAEQQIATTSGVPRADTDSQITPSTEAQPRKSKGGKHGKHKTSGSADKEAEADSADIGPGDSDYQLNHRIMVFVSQRFGQQVGNGECWTLAAEALKAAGALPPKGYVFGRQLAKDEKWWPGDVIQFKTCKFNEKLFGNRHVIIQAGAPNHTAIYGGKQNGMSMIAEQNVNGRKTVATSLLDFDSLVSGTYKVYRPLMPARASSAPVDDGGP